MKFTQIYEGFIIIPQRISSTNGGFRSHCSEATALGVGDGAVVVAIEVFERVPTDLACRPGPGTRNHTQKAEFNPENAEFTLENAEFTLENAEFTRENIGPQVI